MGSKGPQQVRMAVAANKSDVETKAVDPKTMKAYCDENGILFVETSAKSGDNVGALFESPRPRSHAIWAFVSKLSRPKAQCLGVRARGKSHRERSCVKRLEVDIEAMWTAWRQPRDLL